MNATEAKQHWSSLLSLLPLVFFSLSFLLPLCCSSHFHFLLCLSSFRFPSASVCVSLGRPLLLSVVTRLSLFFVLPSLSFPLLSFSFFSSASFLFPAPDLSTSFLLLSFLCFSPVSFLFLCFSSTAGRDCIFNSLLFPLPLICP